MPATQPCLHIFMMNATCGLNDSHQSSAACGMYKRNTSNFPLKIVGSGRTGPLRDERLALNNLANQRPPIDAWEHALGKLPVQISNRILTLGHYPHFSWKSSCRWFSLVLPSSSDLLMSTKTKTPGPPNGWQTTPKQPLGGHSTDHLPAIGASWERRRVVPKQRHVNRFAHAACCVWNRLTPPRRQRTRETCRARGGGGGGPLGRGPRGRHKLRHLALAWWVAQGSPFWVSFQGAKRKTTLFFGGPPTNTGFLRGR